MASDPGSQPLNPLAFPPETDSWYRLLLLASGTFVFSVTYIIVFTLIAGGGQARPVAAWVTAGVLPVGASLVATGLIYAAAWVVAWASMWALRRRYVPFPPPGRDRAETQALSRMAHYLTGLVASIPDLRGSPPGWLWDTRPENRSVATGVALGGYPRPHVGLRRGLFVAFLKGPRSPVRAVLLHELAHIANHDVDRTSYALALTKCVYVFTFVLIVFLNLNVYGGTAILAVFSMLGPGDLGPIARLLATNLKYPVFCLLIEMLLSGFLRTREYYADARARQWLGQPTELLAALQEPARRPLRWAGLWATIWELYLQIYRRYLVPLHPSIADRRRALEDPNDLLRPRLAIAFFSALWSGMTTSLVSFLVAPLAGIMQYMAISQAVNVALALLYNILQLSLFVGIGVMPIVATLGRTIASASFADSLPCGGRRYLPPGSVVQLAGVCALGMSLGLLCSPVTWALGAITSGVLIPAGLVTLLSIGIWTCLWLGWIGSLRLLSRWWLARHTAPSPPTVERLGLTFIAALSLALPFELMYLTWSSFWSLATMPPGQVHVLVTGLQEYLPQALSVETFLAVSAGLLVIGWILALLCAVVIWIGGWLFALVHASGTRSTTPADGDGFPTPRSPEALRYPWAFQAPSIQWRFGSDET